MHWRLSYTGYLAKRLGPEGGASTDNCLITTPQAASSITAQMINNTNYKCWWCSRFSPQVWSYILQYTVTTQDFHSFNNQIFNSTGVDAGWRLEKLKIKCDNFKENIRATFGFVKKALFVLEIMKANLHTVLMYACWLTIQLYFWKGTIFGNSESCKPSCSFHPT